MAMEIMASMKADGSRNTLIERFKAFRRRSREPSTDAQARSPSATEHDGNPIDGQSVQTDGSDVSKNRLTTVGRIAQAAVSVVYIPAMAPAEFVWTEGTTPSHVESITTADSKRIPKITHTDIVDKLMVMDDDPDALESTDLWTAAFREAVAGFGEDIDVTIFEGKSVEHLFRELERMDEAATQESAFLRGVKNLRSMQVPLESFKMAVDLASPLATVEPAAAAVFSVVRTVTVIAISLASADREFASQIAEMLEQISYLDDCDALGQKSNKRDIHKALVPVYQKIIEFYQAALNILGRKGIKLALKKTLEQDHLPQIIKDFIRRADFLRTMVQKTTWEIVDEIKNMLFDREIARWLGSEKLANQNRYHAELRDLRSDKACRFLLQDNSFCKWYNGTASPHLVIFGDVGCGKTIAAAFLIDELTRRSEHQIPRPKVCFHYCRNNETGNATNVLSNLILALLEQLPGIKKQFYDWYKRNQASGNLDPATDPRKLGEFLHTAVKSLDRPLFIVIDGLDECDRQTRTSLLVLLNSLSTTNQKFKTLLSSRYDEEILTQLKGMGMVDLFSNPERDGIIVKFAVDRQLPYLGEEVKALVTSKLASQAQGCAVWTKMIVHLIEIKRISALGPMRLFLDEMPLPLKLSDLYDAIFLRCTSGDLENQNMASIALNILAITRRPLGILEFAWAVTLAAATQEIHLVEALEKLVDYQRVMSLIQPFLARVDSSDLKKHQVQLVHQSVKEFILHGTTVKHPYSGLEQGSWCADITPLNRRAAYLEAWVMDLCVEYLLLEDINQLDLFSDTQLAIEQLPQEIYLFDDVKDTVEYDVTISWDAWETDMTRYDPSERGFGEFFVYAASHWLDHFGAVDAVSTQSLRKIESLCAGGSKRLHNWTQQNCRPGCTLKSRFDFDGRLYDALSITSLYGSDQMLHHILLHADFDNGKFLPNPAVIAADQVLLWGETSRLSILFLADKVGHQLRNLDFFQSTLIHWSSYPTRPRCWDGVFNLVNTVFDVMVEDGWANELLCIAARAGCLPIVKRLMEGAKQNPRLSLALLCGVRHEQYRMSHSLSNQSIGEAVLGNHLDVVQYLLQQDGIENHLKHCNSQQENVLHLASSLCNPEMFRALLDHFREGSSQADCQGNTALMRVVLSSSASGDRYESAKLLIRAVADSRNQDQVQRPFQMAEMIGDNEMCLLLASAANFQHESSFKGDATTNDVQADAGEDGQEVLEKTIPGILIH